MASKAKLKKKIVVSALALAGERGWAIVTRNDIAERAKISLADLHAVARSKEQILSLIQHHLALVFLDEVIPGETDESVRDRLFDVIMQSLEVLEPHRHGVTSIYKDVMGDPVAMIGTAPIVLRGLTLITEAAGLSTDGVFGQIRIRMIGIVWYRAFKTWMEDDPIELAKTMAGLDADLRRLESLVSSLRRKRPEDEAPESEPEADQTGS